MSGNVFAQPEASQGVAPIDAPSSLPEVPIQVTVVPEGVVVSADRTPDGGATYLSNSVLLI
jgi:hypothetical protein